MQSPFCVSVPREVARTVCGTGPTSTWSSGRIIPLDCLSSTGAQCIWPPRPFLLFQLSFNSKFNFFSRSVPFSHTINIFLLVSQFLSCIFNYIKRTSCVRTLSHIKASWRADWPYRPQTIKVPVARSRIQFQLIFLEQDICGMESKALSIVICWLDNKAENTSMHFSQTSCLINIISSWYHSNILV